MWTTLKQLLWQWRLMLITTPSVAAAVLGLRLLGVLQPMEWALLDQFFRWRPPEPQDPRIVIVGINESDIQTYGWPISDDRLRELLQRVNQQNPVAIGLDIYRDLPMEPGHQRLNQFFTATSNVIGITKIGSNLISQTESDQTPNNLRPGAVNPPPSLAKKGQIASNDVVIDRDSKVRRVLLSLKYQDETVLSLGARLALDYLDTKQITLEASQTDPDALILGKATFIPLKANDGGYVRQGLGGFQILANFHNAREGYQTVSMRQVMDRTIPADLMKGKLVFVGLTAESVEDFVYTPYSSSLFSQTIPMIAGVTLHADVASQILSAAEDGRPLIQFWSESLEMLWILLWSGVGATITWSFHGAGTSRRWLPNKPLTNGLLMPLGLSLAAGSLFGAGYLAFLQGWWIPVGPPLLALGGSAAAITIYLARSASQMRQMFGRYLTDEVVTNLLEAPQGFRLGGERRKVTMLMSDLRGFSAISERLPPEEAMAIVNAYLATMTDVISQYNGIINEFIGDGIFVCFGAPVSRPDDPQRAVACAIAMQLALNDLNQQNQALNLPALEMGIGLHTGEVLTGNVGSQKRAKYTVVGSDVNFTSRIESYTVGGQILISKQLYQQVADIIHTDDQFQVQLKGLQELATLYEVIGIGDRFNLTLPKAADPPVTLQYKVLLHCRVIKGKIVDDTPFQSTILKLSAQEAELLLGEPVEELSNLKLSLLVHSSRVKGLGDIYAKVTERLNQDGTIVLVRFTAVPPEIAVVFHYLTQPFEPLSVAQTIEIG